MQMRGLRIVIEASVPYLQGVVEHLGEVTYLPSNQFTREAVKDADWLIVRSITKCNAELLADTSVKLITSATIGFDHIDTQFCKAAGIVWRNAPGCNAEAVGQYVGAVLAQWQLLHLKDDTLEGKTLGIVGLGHVGTVVARYGQALGMRVLYNDPPLDRQCPHPAGVSLATLARECDVLSWHVPLTRGGTDATYHLCNRSLIQKLARKPLLINACRGAVVDTDALLWGYDAGLISHLAIDCWEGEPVISRPLLERTFIATPHIAGFSAEGKANGARKCLEHGIRFFHLGYGAMQLLQDVKAVAPKMSTLTLPEDSEQPLLYALLQTIDLPAIDYALRSTPSNFEELRKSYHYPSEPSRYSITNKFSETVSHSFRLVGFHCNSL